MTEGVDAHPVRITAYSDDAAASVHAPISLQDARTIIETLVKRDEEAISAAGFLDDDFGRYEGLPPKTEWLDDGRDMRLIAPLSYYRPDNSVWPVPSGIKIDGASIPPVFWSSVGGPYEGLHRNASIIHDHYCDTRSRAWRDTHRMFYEAMRCSGLGIVTAKIMYYAVFRFGPRWADDVEIASVPDTPAPPTDADAPGIARDAVVIANADPSLAEIEAMADAQRSLT